MIIQGGTFTGGRIIDASIVTQNLLVWLDANNPSSYPGSGASIYDLSGNGYTHTSSSAGFTTIGGAKCFDCSTSGQINVNGTGPLLPTTGYTYIAWARLLNSTATWRTLWRTSPDDHPLLIESGSNRLGFYDNNGGNFQTAGYDVSGLVNTWVQWVVTGTNSQSNFYINGQPVGSQVAYGAGGNRHSAIGSIGNNQPFGYIANAFLYSTILTSEQIVQNYYALKSRFGV